MKKYKGFTIVELLIVIIVIAILAAITVIAYNGIQNSANDAAIKSDLSNTAKKLEIYKVDNDRYPSSINDLSSLGVQVSKNSYAISPDVVSNFVYCWSTDADNFALLAKSQSGNAFIVQDTTGSVQSFTLPWSSLDTGRALCGSLGTPFNQEHREVGYYVGYNPAWQSWTGAN